MKTIHKIDIHMIEYGEGGKPFLKYARHPEVAIHGDKADVLSVMDIFTRHGYAVTVFPPEVQADEEMEADAEEDEE